jgi:hypothetical protein
MIEPAKFDDQERCVILKYFQKIIVIVFHSESHMMKAKYVHVHVNMSNGWLPNVTGGKESTDT